MDAIIDRAPRAPAAGQQGRAAVGAWASGAARANLAGALGTVWACFGAPGSVLLTLFLKEWLHAAKWQIGLVLTMTYLGPTFEPPGAYLVERFGCRRALFLVTFLLNRVAFFALAAVPLLGPPEACRDLGIGVVLVVVGATRVVAHLGTPAWWSWMADLVPEHRRCQFFGCRNQASNAGTAVSLLVGMALLQTCGGMSNHGLISALFAVGAFFGTLDILLYFRVPEPPMRSRATGQGLGGFVRSFAAPFRKADFRRLILGMGLWSFSSNLVLPFLPVYQRGEVLAGHHLGLDVSWLGLALLTVVGSLAGMLTSRRWAAWIDRLGPRWLLLCGSGSLFVNLAYLVVRPERGLLWLMPVSFLGGALTAAWTVSAQQLLLGIAPRENRSFYVSAYNFTNGWLMAGGPLLGGLLADRLPVLGWQLPGGLPCCYFHALLLLAVVGGMGALTILAGVPATPAPGRRALPPKRDRVLWARVRVLWQPRRERTTSQSLDNGRRFATLS
jgi:MFS family permease